MFTKCYRNQENAKVNVHLTRVTVGGGGGGKMERGPPFSFFFAYFPVHHSFYSSTTKYIGLDRGPVPPPPWYPGTVDYRTCSSTTKYSTQHNLILHHHDPDTVDYSTCSSTTGSICGGNCPPEGASTGKLPAFTHLTQIQLLLWQKYSLHPPDTNTIMAITDI